MKKTKRVEKIIIKLNEVNSFITVRELAEILNVSERTIHNDLISLEELGHKVQKKQGYGIKLLSINNEKNEFVDLDRKIEIAKTLILDEEKVTIQLLSDKYFVSKSSIIADLNNIKNELIDTHTAKIISDIKGTRIEGTEEEVQRLMINFNEQYVGKNIKYLDSKKIVEVYKAYYPTEVIKVCTKTIKSLDMFSLYARDTHYLINILNVLLVLVYRLRQDKHINNSDVDINFDEIMNLNNYFIAKDVLNLVRKEIEFEVKENDIFYLSIHIRANGIKFDANKQIYDDDFVRKVELLISKVSQSLGVNLTKDDELRKNLCLHITNLRYRNSSNIIVKNPLLSQIKKEYTVMFNVVWIVLEELKDELDISINEDEIGFIMIHLQTSYDKIQKNKKIVIVCPNGFTMGNFILNRIRTMFPFLENIEVTSQDSIKNFDLDAIDLIISTIDLDVESVRVVRVSALINEKDIRAIGEIYTDIISANHYKSKFENRLLKNYIEEKYIYESNHEYKMEEVIDIVCNDLVRNHIVSEGYKKSVIERESKGGTSIATLAAIPHGSMDLVEETKVAFWISRSPIKWGKYNVKIIIFLALARKDIKFAKQLLEDIYALVNSKDKVEKEILVLSKELLYKKLKGD